MLGATGWEGVVRTQRLQLVLLLAVTTSDTAVSGGSNGGGGGGGGTGSGGSGRSGTGAVMAIVSAHVARAARSARSPGSTRELPGRRQQTLCIRPIDGGSGSSGSSGRVICRRGVHRRRQLRLCHGWARWRQRRRRRSIPRAEGRAPLMRESPRAASGVLDRLGRARLSCEAGRWRRWRGLGGVMDGAAHSSKGRGGSLGCGSSGGPCSGHHSGLAGDLVVRWPRQGRLEPRFNTVHLGLEVSCARLPRIHGR